MSTSGSVSQWIERLKKGDSRDASRLWAHFHRKLLQVARRCLNGSPRRVADEEDLVAAVFQSFFQRIGDGQFSELSSREELWALLTTITDRKAVNSLRRQMSTKRGGGRVRGESALEGAGSEHDTMLSQLESGEPSPDLIAAVAELFTSLDDEMRRMVRLRYDGHTHEEIARQVNRSVATVERRLGLLRAQWQEELLG